MTKINLCRIIFQFTPRVGGSITHTIELSSHMAPYLNSQVIIAPKMGIDTTELDLNFPFKVYRVNYCQFVLLNYIKTRLLHWLPVAPLVNLSFGMSVIWQCLRLNKIYHFDIIQAHGVGLCPALRVIKFLVRKPTIVMLHGVEQNFNKLSGWYETIVMKMFMPDYFFILDDGTGGPEKFDQLIKQKYGSVVYHGIDTNKFNLISYDMQLAKEYGLENQFVVTYISRLDYWKNPDYALKAFHKFLYLNGGIESVKMLVIGDGVLRSELEQLVQKFDLTDKVKFVGSIKNELVPNFMSVSDIVITTSLVSNMSRSVQEAMACGKPVVTFNSGGTGRTIIDGETGLLVTPGDIDEFAQKLQILCRDTELRNKLGQNARKFIIKNRSWESRIKIELSVYESLLVTKHRNNKS